LHPRMDLLFHHAADMGLDVEYKDLGDRHGEFRPWSKRIVLHCAHRVDQMVSAFAHEVAHAIFHDECSTGWREERADRIGASLIITEDEYAAAEAEVGPHLGALASALEVTPRLVLGWQRWYARLPEWQRS
jgi:hypothetical protein